MLIDQQEIRRLIPHAGSMCLLDGVTSWNDERVTCVASSHRDPLHPLRRNGRLAPLHAFEYGAQAAAIHGALIARAVGRSPIVGYLGALRHARVFVERLDTIANDLEVSARLLFGEGGNAIYACKVAATSTVIAEARITIIERPAAGPCGDS